MITRGGLDKQLFLGNGGILARTKSRAGATTLILDQFTDTNGTAIGSHTIAPTNTPATSWTQRAGTWEIQSNKAQVTGAASHGHCTLDAGKANCTIQASVTIGGDVFDPPYDGAILARWSDTSNFWTIGGNEDANVFRIVERAAGVDTVRASASVNIVGGTFAIVAVLNGTTISGTMDGGNNVSYESASLNQSSTIHGIHGRPTNRAFDNFEVIG